MNTSIVSIMLRTVLGAVVGALLGFVVMPAVSTAAHFDVPSYAPYLLIAAAAVLFNLPAFLYRKSLPTANIVPTGKRSGGGATGSGRTNRVDTPPAPRPAPQPLSVKHATSEGSSKVTYSTAPQADGSLKVTVTTRGLTGREFKGPGGVRTRLERVGGIKWDKPTNVTAQNKRGSGTTKKGGKPVTAVVESNEPTTRTITGTIAAGNQTKVLADLTALLGPATNVLIFPEGKIVNS